MSKSIKQLRENRAELLDKMELLVRTAKADDRDMTTSERDSFETMDCQLRQLDRELEKLETEGESLKAQAIAKARKQRGNAEPKTDADEWKLSDGRPVFALSKESRWQDLPHLQDDPYDGLRVGEVVRSLITGRCDDQRIRNAMSETANPVGGYLVPEQLSAQIIDLARAKSVLMQAGTVTVPMDTDRMVMARVTADPTVEVKTENAAFTSRDVTFDQVGFTAYTIGTMVTASRELADDAPNFVPLIENVMANALATALDNYGLDGTGSQQPNGITTIAGVNTITSVGAIAWEDIHNAVVAIQVDNGQPNAYVLSPTIMGDLTILASGDAANSAKLWLGPPPLVQPLTPFITTNLADADGIVGDFAQSVWGLRQRPLIEVSTEAENAFSKHQVLVKVTWRGDFNLMHEDHFTVLSGITT